MFYDDLLIHIILEWLNGSTVLSRVCHRLHKIISDQCYIGRGYPWQLPYHFMTCGSMRSLRWKGLCGLWPNGNWTALQRLSISTSPFAIQKDKWTAEKLLAAPICRNHFAFYNKTMWFLSFGAIQLVWIQTLPRILSLFLPPFLQILWNYSVSDSLNWISIHSSFSSRDECYQGRPISFGMLGAGLKCLPRTIEVCLDSCYSTLFYFLDYSLIFSSNTGTNVESCTRCETNGWIFCYCRGFCPTSFIQSFFVPK